MDPTLITVTMTPRVGELVSMALGSWDGWNAKTHETVDDGDWDAINDVRREIKQQLETS